MKTLLRLLQIRRTSGWFISQGGLIRRSRNDQYETHECPLEAINVNWRAEDTYWPIGAAADNRGHWLRPVLLKATHLKETQP